MPNLTLENLRERYILVLPNRKMETELTCPCCYDYYNDPVILPCFHSFCRECLHSIFKTRQEEIKRPGSRQRLSKTSQNVGSLPCPSCRKAVELSAGGIDSLQSNFQLRNIVKTYKESTEIKESHAFDVNRTRLTNNGYVHMSSINPHTQNYCNVDDDVTYEDLCMEPEMGRNKQDKQRPDSVEYEGEYATMESLDIQMKGTHEQPTTSTRTFKQSTQSDDSTYNTIHSPGLTSPLNLGPQWKPSVTNRQEALQAVGKRMSTGMFDLANEVAKQASNRKRPDTRPDPPKNLDSRPSQPDLRSRLSPRVTSPEDRSDTTSVQASPRLPSPSNMNPTEKRASFPAHDSPNSWRKGAIRRKSNIDSDSIIDILNTKTEALTMNTSQDQKASQNKPSATRQSMASFAEQAAARVNRRKMSAPAVHPRPKLETTNMRRSRTLDSDYDYANITESQYMNM